MERAIPIGTNAHRRPEWWTQPSTSEPNSSSVLSTVKNGIVLARGSTTIDTKVVVPNGPRRPTLSPATSPPLAVSNAVVVNPVLNGSTISDILSTNPLSVGGFQYVANLPPREWFQLLVTSLPLYAFTATNPSRKVLYSRKRDVASKEAERIRKNGSVAEYTVRSWSAS